MVARVQLGGWFAALALVVGCSRANPAYGLEDGAGGGSSDGAGDDKGSLATDDGKGDGRDTGAQEADGDGGGTGQTGTVDGPGDTGADDDGPIDPTAPATSTSGGDNDTDEVASTGETIAEPDAVYLFAGPEFLGRIEHAGMLGIDAATQACIDTAATSMNACSEHTVAVLATGTPEERAVDFATYLGVVGSTPVRSATDILITETADQFFDGSLDASLGQAGVFPAQTHIWSGFDAAQLSDNCEDWTSDDGSVDGGVGDSSYLLSWAASGNFSCAAPEPILCACW